MYRKQPENTVAVNCFCNNMTENSNNNNESFQAPSGMLFHISIHRPSDLFCAPPGHYEQMLATPEAKQAL